MTRSLLFSISIKDCRVDTFRAGGKGGQNANKVEAGVRIVHEPSGAVGEGRDTRDQLHNKRSAFRRMVASPTFQTWLRNQINLRLGQQTVEQIVDTWMQPENLKIEVNEGEGWIRGTVI